MSLSGSRSARLLAWQLCLHSVSDDTLLALAALVIPFGLILIGIGSYGLLNNNEGMYAEIAREMTEGGSWIIPHLNGLPYIEKPPLVYWLTALFLRGGEQEFLVRLVPALAGALTLAITWWFTARIADRGTAWLAVLVLGSCAGFIAMSRVAMLDIWLTAMLTGALYGAYALLRSDSRTLAIATGASLALAVLAKGWIAAFLFALVLLAYVASLVPRERRAALGRLCAPSLWITFLLLATPWHVAASLELPEFAWFYFINEHVLRFLGMREPHDYYGGPIWYYLPRLMVALIPWSLFLFVRRASTSHDCLEPNGRRFLWIAALVPLIVFSASSAKANYYAIVCMPPLAILIAQNVARLAREHRAGAFTARVVATAFVMLLGVLVLVRTGALEGASRMTAVSAAGILAAAGVAALIAPRLARQDRWSAAAIVVAMMCGPVDWFAVVELHDHEPALSARPWIRAYDDLAGNNQTWIFADFETFSAVPFYLDAPVQIIDSRSRDLAFAQRHGWGSKIFVSSSDVAPDAHGLVWYERRRARQLAVTPVASRLTRLGCSENQCVAALRPAS